MDCVTLSSKLDASVNHVVPAGDGGWYEARYVRRVPERWICYLSSHSGCDKACRFCHLTATRQTMMSPADPDGYMAQAARAFGSYDAACESGVPRAAKVHFNFMSRGEPLDNPTMLSAAGELFGVLAALAASRGLACAHKVSSIIPAGFSGDLAGILADPSSQIYYSLYSVDPAFRKRWMPKAMPAPDGLDLLSDYQRRTGRIVALHWAFIRGENDGEKDVARLLEAVSARGLRAKFNLVRYNPRSARHGEEPGGAALQALFDKVASGLGMPGSRIVPRVGQDVRASCGTFVDDDDMAAAAQGEPLA